MKRLCDFETCSECGSRIPPTEQAYVFENNIVCAECDKKLRNNSGSFLEQTEEAGLSGISSGIKTGNEDELLSIINSRDNNAEIKELFELLRCYDITFQDFLQRLKSNPSILNNHKDSRDNSSDNHTIEIPDISHDTVINELNKTVDMNITDSSVISESAGSQPSKEQAEIKLPSFIHLSFFEKNHSKTKLPAKRHKIMIGLTVSIVIAIVIVLAVILLFKYLY